MTRRGGAGLVERIAEIAGADGRGPPRAEDRAFKSRLDVFLPQARGGWEVLRATNAATVEAVQLFSNDVRKGEHAVLPIALMRASGLRSASEVMLAVGHHLRRVADAIGDTFDGPGHGRSFAPWMMDDVSAVEQAWRHLITSLAAQSSDMQDRRALLDPEAWALELEEQAHATADLPRAFSAFVEALAEAYAMRQGSRRQPIFLFAVTEAEEVTAARHEAILAGLRAMRHPRMVYVLGSAYGSGDRA